MSKINVLSFEIANLIAAGEVVDRPASILKELIENSIDSGASTIVAEIKKGGNALIRVTDNGCGIDSDDLPVALKRHATSKISDKSDLDSIMTLGFRGEALAAISAVSNVTIISKTKDAEVATMLVAEAGNVVDISEVGAADGTTVVVEQLFANVPARRKFLKKDATEAMNVAALVEKVAVSHPEISFQLLIDGEQRFKTPGDGDLYNAIYSVFGKDFAAKLIKTEGNTNGIRVHGYIGRSDNVKKNRNLQNFFINGRYVKSMTAMAAIEKAFTSYIAPECFPTCILFLDINPAYVDVNVHPAKLEVKFTDERAVFEAVYYAVKTALEDHEYRPELELSKKKSDYNPLGAFVPIGADTKGEQIKMDAKNFVSRYVENNERKSCVPPFNRDQKAFVPSGNIPEKSGKSKSSSLSSENHFSGISKMNFEPSTESLSPKESLDLLERYKSAEGLDNNSNLRKEEPVALSLPTYIIVGEAFDCYILVQLENELLVIDKHAAHERIIFEDLKKSQLNDGRIMSQTLLLPLSIILSAPELNAAAEYASELKNVGFDYSVNNNAVDLYAIPDSISLVDAEALFVRMIGDLIETGADPAVTEENRRERSLYQIACKAAIKGGRVYNDSIRDWIVKKVLELPDITVCPHGRPIAYKLTKTELDRQFDRIK